ncbi:MAG TPA: ABC transporter substrate-binding protein [Beutenbergiaceae bacterium]|nr:ABC transporter substrate-binding protein [Beutenbergiaceae bacterium]
MRVRRRIIAAAATSAVLLTAACGAESSDADSSEDAIELEIVAFSPPSLGAFLPAVIAEERFDLDNGLDITFVERPPDAYNTEFGTGQYQIGGSGSLMSEAVRLTEGVDVVYLFNVHDYWGGLVSTTPEITELADLEGRTLAGSTAATNYALFLWFVQAAGVDIDNVTVENHDTGGLGTQAQTGRSDAVQLWEPAYANLMAQEIDHVTDIPLPFELWEEEYGTTDIPFLGVAVHREWLEENQEAADLLQKTYEDAAEWTLANPGEAAQHIADSMDGGDVEALTELISDNDRLGLNVRPAAELVDGIEAVFDAGVAIDYFDEAPPLTLIPED